MLSNFNVKFKLHTYDYDPDAERIGLQAAQALGAEPRRVLKTLMAEIDGKPICVVIPSDHDVSMKKLAAAFHGKTADMKRPADAWSQCISAIDTAEKSVSVKRAGRHSSHSMSRSSGGPRRY
jgi:Cys-tRNA(Pro) deacylase